MIDSLGLLEVYGLASGIEAADAMLKSANVRILNYEMLIPGMITLVVEGDLASCRAAPVSYTHLTLPTKSDECRSRWSPYH